MIYLHTIHRMSILDFFPFIGEGCGESLDMSSIKDEKTCNDAAYNLVETYPDLKELPTKANTHASSTDMFTSNNDFLFGCYWQKLQNGKNYLWFNSFGVKNECPGDSPCISICTKSGEFHRYNFNRSLRYHIFVHYN